MQPLNDVEWVTTLERFDALATDWDALASAVDGTPFALHAWFRCSFLAFARTRGLRVCVVWRNGTIAAAVPFVESRRGLEALANVHTPLFQPLARDEHALAQVVDAAFARSGCLVVAQLPVGHPFAGLAVEAARAAGCRVVVETGPRSPIVDTRGDFAGYRAGMSRNTRSRAERLRRKMAREHAAEFSVLTVPARLGEELAAGLELEASGWKGRRRTAILSSGRTAAFYSSVAEAFHAGGMLRLSRIVLNGELVAFDLCVLHGGRLYLLKTAYDERYASYAPGIVLRLATVERCFELGLDAHELLGDDALWKRQFANSERTLCTLRTYQRRHVGPYAYRRYARPALKRARAGGSFRGGLRFAPNLYQLAKGHWRARGRLDS